MKYFDVNVKDTGKGFKINRDNYAIIDKKSSLTDNYFYDDLFCLEHKEKCLVNFDLNMKYFRSLNHSEFEEKLQEFLIQNQEFIEIKSLSSVDKRSGYYLLVMDDYCQCYIGTSQDIKKRIMNHWSRTKKFDRLIFGDVENSILSIDSFRALDTTRIFVYITPSVYKDENQFIDNFDTRFIINRTAGGRLLKGLTEAIEKRKTRDISIIQKESKKEIIVNQKKDKFLIKCFRKIKVK